MARRGKRKKYGGTGKRVLPHTEYLCALYESGSSSQEIAQEYGVTREAVLFHLRKVVPPRNGNVARQIDPIRIMRAIRDPHVMSFRDADRLHGIGCTPLINFAAGFQLRGAVTRLFRWRRKRAGRRTI